MSDPTYGSKPDPRDYGEAVQVAKDYVADKVSVVSVADAYGREITKILDDMSPDYKRALYQLAMGRIFIVLFISVAGVKFVFDQYFYRVSTVIAVTAIYLILELGEVQRKLWWSNTSRK